MCTCTKETFTQIRFVTMLILKEFQFVLTKQGYVI